MTSLLDIAPLTASVTVRGTVLNVTGITAEGVVPLLEHFPEVRAMMAGKRLPIAPERLVQMITQASVYVIAAGLGHPGDKKIIEAARNLALGEQGEIVQAILKLTFPSGVGPFMDAIQALVGDTLGDAGDAASGWAADMKSQEPSSGASQTATPQS